MQASLSLHSSVGMFHKLVTKAAEEIRECKIKSTLHKQIHVEDLMQDC